MEKVVTDYLKLLNISVSESYCKKRIASHPDYPSLLSVADTFEHLGIPYGAVRLKKDQLATLTFPYLLHVEKGGGEFVIVRDQIDLNKKPELLEDWNGIVLQVEAPESIEDEENEKHLKKEKTGHFVFGLFLISVLTIATISWLQSYTLITFLFLLTAITGAVVGYLLIAKDLGVNYDAVESFCNSGKKTSCDQVLQSNEATLFGQLSLSDAVLSYFSVQFITVGLFIPLAGHSAPLWWALAVAGIFSLPMVIYSFWLQAVKIKTWCRLCLLVAGVLILQAGLFGWMVATGVFGLTAGALASTTMVWGLFLAIGCLVFLIKSHLKEGMEAEQAEASANRVKYNPAVFTHLLLQQPKIDCRPFEHELLIGKPEAPVNITMAASLGCGPCKEGFEQATRLVKMYPDQVRLSVRFSIPPQTNGHETDPGRYILGYWICRIYGTKQPSGDTENLLQDWFELVDLSRFREQYPLQVNGKDPELETLADRHAVWFDKAEIKGTPTFIVNGYKLPERYRVEDLRYLVAGFSELLHSAGEKMNEAEID